MSKIGISLKTTGKSSVIVKVFQVIVVTAVCGTFTFGHVISLIVMICNMTNIIILPFILVYLFWFLVYDFKRSSKGGRRWETLRKLSSWNYYRDYFPVRLVKTTQLSPEKNYIFGYHPHGVMCSGAWCNFATEATGFGKLFPGLTPHLLTLKCKLSNSQRETTKQISFLASSIKTLVLHMINIYSVFFEIKSDTK